LILALKGKLVYIPQELHTRLPRTHKPKSFLCHHIFRYSSRGRDSKMTKAADVLTTDTLQNNFKDSSFFVSGALLTMIDYSSLLVGHFFQEAHGPNHPITRQHKEEYMGLENRNVLRGVEKCARERELDDHFLCAKLLDEFANVPLKMMKPPTLIKQVVIRVAR